MDTSLFPEEEFPVYCPRCNYLLRGLPGSQCPECGREFDRGRLLVEQYVNESGKRAWRHLTKPAFSILFASFAVVVVLSVATLLTWLCLRHNLNFYFLRSQFRLRLFVASMLAVAAGGMCLAITFIILFARWMHMSRRKRGQVFEAIDQTQPHFSKAQRYWWVLACLWLTTFSSFVGWQVYSDGVVGSCVQHPLRLVVVVSFFILSGGFLWS